MKIINLLILLLPLNSLASEQEAITKALTAWAIQSGTDQYLEERAEVVLRKIPSNYKKSLDYLLPVVDTLIKQEIKYTIKF